MSGERKALIVANDKYDQEALRTLLAPGADAEALGRVLGDPQIGEFTVQVVRNEPSHVIQAQIEELFSESRPDDVVLIHFSGHGLKSESGELYFAASNTRPNRLGSTAVSADFVQRCMRESRSRSIVVLLDCCYGGAFAQGVSVRAAGDVNVLDSFPQGKHAGGRGRAVITASNAMEYAFEGDQLADDRHRRPSVFTSALVEGLATGEADRDEDGWVSLNELYDYVFDKVREQNPHQTPSRQFELEGELYLARSRRLRIRPAPLPPDLQAALADPNMYTRLGAVSELRSRLLSDDLPVAAGAHQALADLARNDIRTVAQPAAAAVTEGVVRPEETELHFGRIEQGSAPPHRIVRLLGPPIARACTPRASDDWIRVAETPGGFDISVDTNDAGIRRGTLDLKGPTGEAAIAIDVELLRAEQEAAAKAELEAQQAAAREAEEKARLEAQQAAAREAEEKARLEAHQAAAREAEEKARREAQQAAKREAEEKARQHVPSSPGSRTEPGSTTQPVTAPASRPPIRRGAAFAGSGVALLAGIAGVITWVVLLRAHDYGPYVFFNIVSYVVAIAVAIAALLQIHRLPVIGLLQGMWWPAVALVAGDIVGVSAEHVFKATGYALTSTILGIISSVLGVIAAILLFVSWRLAADLRHGSRFGALPATLVCVAGLSQIANLIFALKKAPQYFPYTVNASASILVGLAIAWYAVSLRARALGGALLLGWATIEALPLIGVLTLPGMSATRRVWGVVGLVLLIAVVILTLSYMRGPSDPDPSVEVTDAVVGGG